MVEDVCPLPGAGQNRPLHLLLPPHVQIEDDLINGGPCPPEDGEVAKALHVVRLATHKLLVYVDDVVGLELLATTLADNMATVLPKFVLVRCWQRLESLVADITGVNHLSLLCFVLLCSTNS